MTTQDVKDLLVTIWCPTHSHYILHPREVFSQGLIELFIDDIGDLKKIRSHNQRQTPVHNSVNVFDTMVLGFAHSEMALKKACLKQSDTAAVLYYLEMKYFQRQR